MLSYIKDRNLINSFINFRQAKDRYFYDGAESLKGFPTSEFDMEMKQTDDSQTSWDRRATMQGSRWVKLAR